LGFFKFKLFYLPNSGDEKSAGIKPGNKMVAMAKHGIIQHIPVLPLKDVRVYL
jgi:hypothetical protein